MLTLPPPHILSSLLSSFFLVPIHDLFIAQEIADTAGRGFRNPPKDTPVLRFSYKILYRWETQIWYCCGNNRRK